MNLPELQSSDARTQRTWQALGEVADHPVVAAWRDQARKKRAPRMQWALAAAVVMMLTAGVVAYVVIERPAPASGNSVAAVANGEYKTVATARGGRRKVLLADGSRIVLNTLSRVKVDYRGTSRRIELLEGEALFEVAKDPHRPFVVVAADREIKALGTSFGVRLDGPALQVTLVEGRVAVGQLELKPGQQLIEREKQAPFIRKVDVARTLSWQSGWLVLNRDTVRDAIREISRYANERITCDPRLLDLHVSGTFRTGEIDTFVVALAEIHPLTVEQPSPGVLHLAWRE